MKKKWIILAIAALVGTTTTAFISQDQEAAAPQTAAADHNQPIAFPHNTHAGTYQIDCQYCHFSAERSVDAGIPPVSTCMGCHTLIPGPADGVEIAKISAFAASGVQIPWVRIHKVADHVHFPHMRHINAGLTCQECHGPIEEKGVLVEPDPIWGNGSMGWCVTCHVEREVSRDCTVCHY